MNYFINLPSELQLLILDVHMRRDQIAKRWLRRYRLRKLNLFNQWYAHEELSAPHTVCNMIDIADFMIYYRWNTHIWADMTWSQKRVIYNFYIERYKLRHNQRWKRHANGLEYERYTYDTYDLTPAEQIYWNLPPHKNYTCSRCDDGYIETLGNLSISADGEWYCQTCTEDGDSPSADEEEAGW